MGTDIVNFPGLRLHCFPNMVQDLVGSVFSINLAIGKLRTSARRGIVSSNVSVRKQDADEHRKC